MSDDKDFTKVVSWFKNNHDRAMVALSGGVDSAVVALAAKQAKEIGINHITVKYNELENENFVRNDRLR